MYCYNQLTLKRNKLFCTPTLNLSNNYFLTEHNYALSGTASQSDAYYSQIASNAVDGDLNTHSASTYEYYVRDYWWKVDIGERIIFTNATIYVRGGKCGAPPFDCCKYFYLSLQRSSIYLEC